MRGCYVVFRRSNREEQTAVESNRIRLFVQIRLIARVLLLPMMMTMIRLTKKGGPTNGRIN